MAGQRTPRGDCGIRSTFGGGLDDAQDGRKPAALLVQAAPHPTTPKCRRTRMDQANAIPASAKNQRREIIAWCMYDWANSAYSTIYITVLVLYLQGAVLPGDAGLTAWGWGIGVTTLCYGLSLADPRRHRRRAGQQARLAVLHDHARRRRQRADVLRHAGPSLVVRGHVSDCQSELRAGAVLLQRVSARDRRRSEDGLGVSPGALAPAMSAAD